LILSEIKFPAANFTNAREFSVIFREIRVIRGRKNTGVISDKVHFLPHSASSPMGNGGGAAGYITSGD
jgi:hypothetical protein